MPRLMSLQVMHKAWYIGRAALGPLQGIMSPTIVSQQYFITLYHEYCRYRHADATAHTFDVQNAFQNWYMFSRLNETREDRLFEVFHECVASHEAQVYASPSLRGWFRAAVGLRGRSCTVCI